MIYRRRNLIQFEFYKPNLSNLAVTGSFSDWKPIQLTKSEMGYWRGDIKINREKRSMKEFEFRYVSKNTDGTLEWFTDFTTEVRSNHLGLNSVVKIVEED